MAGRGAARGGRHRLGYQAERLAGGNAAIALLANTAATVAALATLISVFAPVSGAHFNPVITLAALLRGGLPPAQAAGYAAVQVAGCCVGAMLANAMFDLPLLEAATRVRTGSSQWLSEAVATAGLVLVALTSTSTREAAWRVAAWIGAAYWFTASTSFANPAIAVGRSLSDSFAGIRPVDVPAFAAAQFAGGLIGILAVRLVLPRSPAKA